MKRIILSFSLQWLLAGCVGNGIVNSSGDSDGDVDADSDADAEHEGDTGVDASADGDTDCDADEDGGDAGGGCLCDIGRECDETGSCCVPLTSLLGDRQVGYDVTECAPLAPTRCHTWRLNELDGDTWSGVLNGTVLLDGSAETTTAIQVTRTGCSTFHAVLVDQIQPSTYELSFDGTSELEGSFVWTFEDGEEVRACEGLFSNGCT